MWMISGIWISLPWLWTKNKISFFSSFHDGSYDRLLVPTLVQVQWHIVKHWKRFYSKGTVTLIQFSVQSFLSCFHIAPYDLLPEPALILDIITLLPAILTNPFFSFHSIAVFLAIFDLFQLLLTNFRFTRPYLGLFILWFPDFLDILISSPVVLTNSVFCANDVFPNSFLVVFFVGKKVLAGEPPVFKLKSPAMNIITIREWSCFWYMWNKKD